MAFEILFVHKFMHACVFEKNNKRENGNVCWMDCHACEWQQKELFQYIIMDAVP